MLAQLTTKIIQIICYGLFGTGLVFADSMTVTHHQHPDLQHPQRTALQPDGECVILLHGMGRTAFSMRSMEKHLNAHGYSTINRSYPSTSETIETLSKTLIPDLLADCKTPVKKIHFVTHSLGGIIIRHYLQTNSLTQGSRIIMLSPPNKGSEVADRLKNFGFYKWLMGPAGQQLTTDRDSLPNSLSAIPYEIGIIAGRRTMDPWFSYSIPGQDDGKVSLESTRLKEMQDFLIVDSSHAFIMRSDTVKQQVIYFLQHGYFSKPPKHKP